MQPKPSGCAGLCTSLLPMTAEFPMRQCERSPSKLIGRHNYCNITMCSIAAYCIWRTVNLYRWPTLMTNTTNHVHQGTHKQRMATLALGSRGWGYNKRMSASYWPSTGSKTEKIGVQEVCARPQFVEEDMHQIK